MDFTQMGNLIIAIALIHNLIQQTYYIKGHYCLNYPKGLIKDRFGALIICFYKPK